MNRAYSLIEVKSLDEDRRVFKGWATTPALDRVSDTIDPLKATFAADLPLLHQHRHDAPIGRVKFEKPTKSGIAFEAQIPNIAEPGPLRDRIETAWGEIKHGLVRAVSIGFRATEDPEFNKKGGVDFNGIEIFELSTVTIPANSEAIITAVKSIDAEAREAAGVETDPLPQIPEPKDEGATAKTVRVVKLDDPARDRAKPHVIKKIVRT